MIFIGMKGNLIFYFKLEIKWQLLMTKKINKMNLKNVSSIVEIAMLTSNILSKKKSINKVDNPFFPNLCKNSISSKSFRFFSVENSPTVINFYFQIFSVKHTQPLAFPNIVPFRSHPSIHFFFPFFCTLTQLLTFHFHIYC